MSAGYELTNTTVEAIGALRITGDVVPPIFFQVIKFENGKPDLLGVLILADVLYWYRPYEMREERTSKSLGWRQKFKGDKLERSYDDLADKFGATDRMVADACKRLKRIGLITIEIRPLFSGGSLVFIEPVFEQIKALILCSARPTPERKSDDPTYVETSVGQRQNVSRTTPERKSSNTKTSTESTQREPEPLSFAVEEIFPGHAGNWNIIGELVAFAIKQTATPAQVRAFPEWLARTYPKKAISPYAFKDLFAQFITTQVKSNSAPFVPHGYKHFAGTTLE